MFGYIKPYVPSLTVAEHEAYKAVYCGLCREMGRATGQTSRLFLSFDITYLAVFRAALEEIRFDFGKRVCISHLFTRRTFVKSNPVLRYCAYVSAILSDGKVSDDKEDEQGLRKAASILISPVTGRIRKRCGVDIEPLYRAVSNCLLELAVIEKNNTPSIDIPADVSARMVSAVTSYGLNEPKEKIAREVGYRIGKIIYVLDAADDVFKDIKCEKYNPLALLYGKELFDNSDKDMIAKSIADGLYTAICLESEKLRHALDLADFSMSPTLSGIIYNVANEGIKASARHILYKTGVNENPFRHSY